MRNDNKSWKKGVQRVGKQFGGPLARPMGVGARPMGGVGARPMGGVGARPMGGVGARPMGGVGARPLGLKGGKSAVKNNIYKKGGKAK